MDAETLAKVMATYEAINSKKSEKAIAKKAVKNSVSQIGVSIVHNVSGKLGAILPVGMSAIKLASLVAKNAEAIQEFRKTDNEQILKL